MEQYLLFRVCCSMKWRRRFRFPVVGCRILAAQASKSLIEITGRSSLERFLIGTCHTRTLKYQFCIVFLHVLGADWDKVQKILQIDSQEPCSSRPESALSHLQLESHYISLIVPVSCKELKEEFRSKLPHFTLLNVKGNGCSLYVFWKANGPVLGEDIQQFHC